MEIIKNNKNYFISFEGIDGSGKDTQLFELLKIIKNDDNYPFGDKYSNIWVTRNPTKITESGKEISKLIRIKEVDGKTAARLYIKDRIEHSKLIRENLKHSHVFSSRFDLSTFTYQLAQGESFEELYELHKFNKENGCIIPDITIVFIIDPEISFKRISIRGEVTECFEKIEFQRKLIKTQEISIKKLREKGRKIITIDANQKIEDITKEMVEKINSLIKNNEL